MMQSNNLLLLFWGASFVLAQNEVIVTIEGKFIKQKEQKLFMSIRPRRIGRRN